MSERTIIPGLYINDAEVVAAFERNQEKMVAAFTLSGGRHHSSDNPHTISMFATNKPSPKAPGNRLALVRRAIDHTASDGEIINTIANGFGAVNRATRAVDL